MSQDDIDSVVDRLLVFMLDDLEAQGFSPDTATFCFTEGGEDYWNFYSTYPEVAHMLQRALNVCLARRYVKHASMDTAKFDGLRFTSQGHERALSAKLERSTPQAPPGILINELHAHAPVQVGHGNTMSIEIFRATVLSRIDSADASPEEKDEAKGLLARALEHPLLCAIVGGLVGGAVSGLGGGKP